MPPFATALFLYDAVLTVHGFDARSSENHDRLRDRVRAIADHVVAHHADWRRRHEAHRHANDWRRRHEQPARIAHLPSDFLDLAPALAGKSLMHGRGQNRTRR